MKEDGLFVDNPLELGSLFGNGVFMVADSKETAFVYHGAGNQKILNVFYYDRREIPPAALQLIGKLMLAVKWNGQNLDHTDFACINAAGVNTEDRLSAIAEDFEPKKLILWSDDWFSIGPPPSFYINSSIGGIELLRCHSLETMMADEDRKKECWLSIKRFFGMS